MTSQSPKPRSTWRKSNTANKTTKSPYHHITKSPKRRGALSPLLTEEAKSTATIQALSYDFACRITRLYQYLTEDSQYKEYIISKQVFRSGTSIGANVKESQHPQSDADFLSKTYIAYKEAGETEYWLNLLHDNGYINDAQFTSINNDCQRIMRVLTAITRTTKAKLQSKTK